MYWFTLTSLLHKNIAQRRFVKCFCSGKCKIGGLNTDLSAKANLSGENRYDSTNLVSKVVGVNKDSFVHAQFVAESQNKWEPTSRAGYGFHNDGITGGFLYLDNDHRLKFIDSKGNIGVIVMESP